MATAATIDAILSTGELAKAPLAISICEALTASDAQNSVVFQPAFIAILLHMISIITTYRNPGEYFKHAIASVMQQTLPSTEWEWILFDDGSDDGSRAWVPEASWVRSYGTHGVHLGRNAALKECVKHARGHMLAWFDADDMLAPHALWAAKRALSDNPMAGWCYSDYYETDSEGHYIRMGRRTRVPFSLDAQLGMHMTFGLRVFWRSVFEACGGIGMQPAAIDYDICLRAAEVAEPQLVPLPLYKYRRHESQLSVTDKPLQTAWAVAAVNAAISRRGQSAEYCAHEVEGRFRLLRSAA